MTKNGEKKRARKEYKKQLRLAQIALVRAQQQVIESERKVVVLFEGRDAAGKNGTIKRVVEHLSPRQIRVVALGKPSDLDRRSWYFQRYVAHLAAGGEIALFNRSWYNRAGVERVLGFCTDDEYEQFMHTVPLFEEMMFHCGVVVIKYYLDISKNEQARRLSARRKSVLHQWKNSPLDNVALENWKGYSKARNEMLTRTHRTVAPWTIVQADDKRLARLNVIRDLVVRLGVHADHDETIPPDPVVIFPFNVADLENGTIAP